MNNNPLEKQEKIEKIFESFFDKNSLLNNENDQKKESLCNEYCKKLFDILTDDFRPYYFFIPRSLTNTHEKLKSVSSLSSINYNIKLIIEYLDEIKKIDDRANFNENEYEYLKKYIDNPRFQYNVNMFFNAIYYEIDIVVDKKAKELEGRESKEGNIEENHTDRGISIIQDFNKTGEDLNNLLLSTITSAETKLNDTVTETGRNLGATISDAETKLKGTILDAETKLNHVVTETGKNLGATISDAETKLNGTISDAETKLNGTIEDTSKSLDATIVEVKNQTDSLMANMLAVLGIFVSVIVIFIGGYYITGAGINAETIKISQVMFAYYILMGQVLFNLLFMLLFMISRLSGKKVSVHCNECTKLNQTIGITNPDKMICLNEECNYIKKAKKKYPYIIATNIIFVCTYFICFLWWVFDEFIYTDFFAFIMQQSVAIRISLITIFAIIVILLVVVFARVIIKLTTLKIKEKKNPTENN